MINETVKTTVMPKELFEHMLKIYADDSVMTQTIIEWYTNGKLVITD